MTKVQKEQTRRLRKEGFGYKKIAGYLCLSENTIKSFCRREGLAGEAFENDEVIGQSMCKCCGLPIKQIRGRKKKKFCSNKCRNDWWNEHPELIDRRSANTLECAYCHKPFKAYGYSNRKYCCHECYVSDRFGGKGDE